MESIPVCGVEIKNETEEPFVAPLLKNEIPVGITPHEQRGNGIPIKDAFKTDLLFFCPKYLSINRWGKATLSIPAKKNPSIKYGDISLRMSTKSDINRLM